MSGFRTLTPYDLMRSLDGVREIPGAGTHPYIAWALSTCGGEPVDEIAWCSAALNECAIRALAPHTNSLAARSWLGVGKVIHSLDDARVGWDAVVFRRGKLAWQGHAGLYHAHDSATVAVWGGNQQDSICLARFPREDVIGIRRLI